jgi:hypothetical protein
VKCESCWRGEIPVLDRDLRPTKRRCPNCFGLIHYIKPTPRTYADGVIALHSTNLRFEEVVELLPNKET